MAGRGSGTVHIEADGITLAGDVQVPEKAQGVVLFAHGSGSSRLSPRNRFVAGQLNEVGLATLLLDLLTEEEEQVDVRTRHLRFDLELLSRRLVAALAWLSQPPQTSSLEVGLFGASTGAGAALMAAAARPDRVAAVVSRGGRPDLAGEALARVSAPTLLIVGGADTQVLALNERTLAQLGGDKQLTVIPGASHLFEEPGALEQVARLALEWFRRHLKRGEG